MADNDLTYVFFLCRHMLNRRKKLQRKNVKFIGQTDYSLFQFLLKRIARKMKMRLLLPLFMAHCRERNIWMLPKSDAWFVMADTLFDEERWYSNFRVSRRTFQYLLDSIQNEITCKRTRLRDPVSARCRLAITLYFLGSTSEYRRIANLFGVSTAFVCKCITEVCQAIIKILKSSLVCLPKGNELGEIIEAYSEKWGFPMCCGAIDGTHIPIVAPTKNPADYVNRKKYHSIVMQAVVDSDYLFRDFVVGWHGSVHDARVLSTSTLYDLGIEGRLFDANISRQIHGTTVKPLILGDAAYPLLPWLMKPYPHNPDIPVAHKHFNYRLSRARMTVENTFGRWKGRFRRFLKTVDMNVMNLTTAVAASCIVHNLCEMSHEEVLHDWLLEVESANAADKQNAYPVQEILEREDSSIIRDAIAEFLSSDAGANIGSGGL